MLRTFADRGFRGLLWFQSGRFLEIELARKSRQGTDKLACFGLRDGDDPTDEYSRCGVGVPSILEAAEYQKEMNNLGWKYAILIEDDGGDD